MKPTFFSPGADIVPMDQNPEMADIDNPRGYRYGYATYVYAEDNFGHRRRLYIETLPCSFGELRALERADRTAKALAARLRGGRLPVAFDRWETVSPAYGSYAYIEEGGEEELIAWEQRALEDELAGWN